MPSAPRRSSTGCSTATAFRPPVLARRASSCAGAPTTRRRAWSRRPRSCSRRCSPSWRSAISSTGGDVYGRAVAARSCAACLRRARDGDRAGAPAAAHPQRRARCRRGRAHGDRRPHQRVRALDPGEPDDLARRRRRRRFNLLLLGYALPAVLCCCSSYAVVGRAARSTPTLSRPARCCSRSPMSRWRSAASITARSCHRRDQRRRAIHLFDRLARLRRGAARRRHLGQFASGRGWPRPP